MSELYEVTGLFRLTVSRLSPIRALGTFLFAMCNCAIMITSPCNDVRAEGFPEKGNRADWSDAIPYYNQGNKFLQSQRYEDAVTCFEDAVGIYPFDPDFFINLGVAYRKVDEYKKAEQAFHKACELNAKDWMSWSNLANSYLKQNKYKETKSAFEKALKLNPPAAEQTAIKKDLMDLQKIISMQEMNAKAAAARSRAASKTAAAKSTTAKPTNTRLGQLAKPATAETHATSTGQQPTRQQLKDSGWDYSQ